MHQLAARLRNTVTIRACGLRPPLVILGTALIAGDAQGHYMVAFPPRPLCATNGNCSTLGRHGRFNRDGGPESGGAALTVRYGHMAKPASTSNFREDAEDGVLTLQFSAEGKLWGSGGSRRFYGQEPSLKALDNGSLAVTSRIGRSAANGWSSTAPSSPRRGERFIGCPGYTYNSFDTLQEDEPLNCDLQPPDGTRRR